MPVRPKPFQVHLYGPDEPGATESFASLDAVREYLSDRLEYWDGQDGGHSDFMRYSFTGFTMKDIGARRDECWVKFDLPWPALPVAAGHCEPHPKEG